MSDNEEALRAACTEVWPAVPQLLCLWHINKNVQDHLQKHFKRVNGPFDPNEAERTEQVRQRDEFMQAWVSLNYAKTEAQYEERWTAIRQKYRQYGVLIHYIESVQYPQRTRVAAAWTSQYRHFGHTTTSKLESAHHQLKTCLPHSQGHIQDVIKNLVNYWDDCYREYEAKLAGQYITIRAETNAQIISEWDNDLNRWITPYALRLCREQLDKARKNEMAPSCSGKFTTIWGIPCCHDMRTWARIGRLVQASDFDHHWYWERPGAENVFQRATVEAQRLYLLSSTHR